MPIKFKLSLSSRFKDNSFIEINISLKIIILFTLSQLDKFFKSIIISLLSFFNGIS